MSTDITWNATSNTLGMNLIENLIKQLPPSGKTFVSDKIDVSNFPTTSSSSYKYQTENKQGGSKFIYVPEYNDLFVCQTIQFSSAPQGNVIIVFHDFINPHTQEPSINPANSTQITIDLIPHLSDITGATYLPVLPFWQHNHFWLMYGIPDEYTSEQYQRGELLRYSYDGVKLTKEQTIEIPHLSTYYWSNQQTVYYRFYGELSELDNGYLWSQSAAATKGFLHRIVEDTENDTFTVETGELDWTVIFPELLEKQNPYNYINKLDVFYFAQLRKHVYCMLGNSNNINTSFNTNVDESSWSNLISSLNNPDNWHTAQQQNMPTTHEYDIFAIQNRSENKTILFTNQSVSNNQNVAYADSVEQLEQERKWNTIAANAGGSTVYRIATSNRMYFVNFIRNKAIIPSSPEPVEGTNDIYDNDYTYLYYEMPPTWNEANKIRFAWTEDGKNLYSKVVDLGARMYVPINEPIGFGDTLYKKSFILDRYYITWIDDDENVMSNDNKYGKIAVIDFSTKI